MNKVAFIFPGQGSQAVGMGVPLVEKFPSLRALYDEASGLLGWDLLQACREGPDERLRQTDVAQPALYVTGYAAFEALRSSGVLPAAVAGHSIGEYAALAAAGVFDFRQGLALVRERGGLMQAAARALPGGMAAILGLGREAVQTLCASIQAQHGVCVPVNFNSPEQIVAAGEKPAVEALAAAAPGAGAKRVVLLNVSGAFHSPLMREAALEMKAELARTAFRDAAWPVAMNVDGRCRQAALEIQNALAQQLDHPVEWVRSVETLKRRGCTIFVECGSGRVLGGLVRRIGRQLQVYSTETIDAFHQALQQKTSSPRV
jgi:[acyl-carrier-protein] S-malonyltransferase